MIFYLVSQDHSNTIYRYLSSWGKSLIPQIRPLPYEHLFRAKSLQTGTYIFSDIERLSPDRAEIAAQVWKDLSEASKTVRILNNPTYSMRRYELLRTLYERGSNKFNIYRITECRIPQRFPVFIRGENDHTGSISPLLQTPEELEDAIREIVNKGHSRENKVIIEFCDTSDEKGIFRKYSALIVGEKIIARHIFFSKNWMTKKPDLLDEEVLLEEQQYIKKNPHEEQLREIFHLARISYGRIDYGISNGVIQVWEINTNPVTLAAIDKKNDSHLKRLSVHEHFAEQLTLALEAINYNANSVIQIRTSIQEKFPQEPSARQLMTELMLELLPAKYQLAARERLKTLKKLFRKQR